MSRIRVRHIYNDLIGTLPQCRGLNVAMFFYKRIHTIHVSFICLLHMATNYFKINLQRKDLHICSIQAFETKNLNGSPILPSKTKHFLSKLHTKMIPRFPCKVLIIYATKHIYSTKSTNCPWRFTVENY